MELYRVRWVFFVFGSFASQKIALCHPQEIGLLRNVGGLISLKDLDGLA